MLATSRHPTLRLWDLLARPIDSTEAFHVLFGLDVIAAKHVVARATLSDPAVRRALEAAPALLHRPRTVDHVRTEVVVGAVTGRIDWHRTMVARASAGFPDDVFACTTYARTVDVPENRLLAAVLQRWSDAGTDLVPASRFDDEELRACRAASRKARELLAHPVLGPITTSTRDSRSLSKVRHGVRRRRYRAITEAAARSTDQISEELLRRVLDRRTQHQHDVLVAVLDVASSLGHSRELRVEGSELVAGPVSYRHPGERGGSGPGGIRVGSLLIDVPGFPGHSSQSSPGRLVVERGSALQAHEAEIVAQLRVEGAQPPVP